MSSMRLMALGGAWVGAFFWSAIILSNWMAGRSLLLTATLISVSIVLMIVRMTPKSK